MIARNEAPDRIEPTDATEPTDRTDAAEPTEPIEYAEPTEAIEQCELRDRMDSDEPCDHNERVDVPSFRATICRTVPRRQDDAQVNYSPTQPIATCVTRDVLTVRYRRRSGAFPARSATRSIRQEPTGQDVAPRVAASTR